MTGIVVVAHSRALAQAAVDLAGDMVDGTALSRVRIAAGLDDTTFGTDAGAVAAAITDVDDADGVLVLLDLGSAVLSAEMALELLDPAVRGRVRLSSAALVEGLVAAVVTAAGGASLEEVAAEAAAGLTAKQEHLRDGPQPARAAPSSDAAPAAPPVDEVLEITIDNPHGLHARPAAKLVGLARSLDARITVANLETGQGPVDAASLSLVATLNVRQGSRVRVTASGGKAHSAVRAIQELAARRFDDAPTPGPSRAAAAPTGSGLDIALGPAVVPDLEVDTSGYVPAGVEDERQRSRAAATSVSHELEASSSHTAEQAGSPEASVFEAHIALLSDPEVVDAVETDIASGQSAVQAWATRLDALADRFAQLDDTYQRARAQDVRAVRRQVLRALTGQRAPVPPGEGVLVVPEIDAATAAGLDAEATLGIVTVSGGNSGHGVIIAKSRGIPIITGVGDAADGVEAGTTVAFDASAGTFWADPGPEQVRRIRATVADRRRGRTAALADAESPAVTTDGCRVAVRANVGSVADAATAASNGADGSGLVRTEVLLGGRTAAPSAEEQADALIAVAQALGGRPITVRTWDVGGDKPLQFLPMDAEVNPFLGARGLRAFRSRPEVLHEQLKAVCMTAHRTPVQVMFPMVTTVEEVEWARGMLAAAADEVSGGLPDGLHVGIMVEVPAAALRVGLLAADLDFVSIGTNDLTQYTLAAERGNRSVATLSDGLDPTVLALVAEVCRGVPDGVDVAVCGDLASDAAAATLLVGLGVRELSVTAPAVPIVKAGLRATDLAGAERLATRALSLSSAAEVRAMLGST